MDYFSLENVMPDLKYFAEMSCFDYIFENTLKQFGSNTQYLILIKLVFS